MYRRDMSGRACGGSAILHLKKKSVCEREIALPFSCRVLVNSNWILNLSSLPSSASSSSCFGGNSSFGLRVLCVVWTCVIFSLSFSLLAAYLSVSVSLSLSFQWWSNGRHSACQAQGHIGNLRLFICMFYLATSAHMYATWNYIKKCFCVSHERTIDNLAYIIRKKASVLCYDLKYLLFSIWPYGPNKHSKFTKCANVAREAKPNPTWPQPSLSPLSTHSLCVFPPLLRDYLVMAPKTLVPGKRENVWEGAGLPGVP